MTRLIAAAVTALLFGAVATPAEAATYKIGGKCTKSLQVRTIKGVRAQCTWVSAPMTKKKGKLVWKALPPAKLRVTREELLGITPATTDTSTSTTDTATATPETGTVTPTP